MNSKNKYFKYKNKYLNLKKKLSNIQKAGMVLNPILFNYDKDRFEELYRMKIKNIPDGENKNSFQILLDLFHEVDIETNEPYNILVGVNCMNDNDYLRFKDSSTYSLYIDNTKLIRDPERQYFMYTIDYDDISENFTQMLPNSVQQIHFDTGVSYFAPIKYLELAEHLLIPGGKIVWDLLQHSGSVIFYKDGKFKKNPSLNFSDEEITNIFSESRVVINTETKTIFPGLRFFENNTICPQIRLSILDMQGRDFTRFKNYPYYGFLEFCSNKYTSLRFEQKTYSFSDYTYPVPIRIINPDLQILTFNNFVDLIVNSVMNLIERTDYIKNKKISIEKIIQLANRIKRSVELQRLILEKNIIPENILSICKDTENPIGYNLEIILENFLSTKFTEEFEYIEAIKI